MTEPHEGRVIVGCDVASDGSATLVVVQQQHTDGGWTDLGWTSQDGITFGTPDSSDLPEPTMYQFGDRILSMTTRGPIDPYAMALYTGRPATMSGTAPGPPPPGDPPPAGGLDLLDRINALVADVEQDTVVRCACGCQAVVPPDGDSLDFAGPACQARWHNEQATDPDDVYRRPDAAVTLARETPRNPPAPAAAQPVISAWRRVEPSSDLYGAAYRRSCVPCGERVIPVAYEHHRSEHPGQGGPTVDDALARTGQSLRLECPHCGEDLPGPAFLATVTETSGTLTLQLADHQARVKRSLPVGDLQRAVDPAGLIAAYWHDMEAGMARFHTTFNGRRPGGR